MNQEDFARRFEECRPAMLRFVRSMGAGAEAEDLVSEVCHKAWADLNKWPEGVELRTWLFRLANSEAVNWIRKKRRRKNDPWAEDFELADPEIGSPEQTLLSKEHQRELARDIADCLDGLTAEQRLMIALHHLKALPLKECLVYFEGMGLPLLKKRLMQARTALAPCLRGKGWDPADV